MPTYVQPTLDEFRALLATMRKPPTYTSTDARQEPFFEWLLPPRTDKGPALAIRLYSSLQPNRNGGATVGRPAGADAIRVVVVRDPRRYEERVIYAATRIHRVPGWPERTLVRLRETWAQLRTAPSCPLCDDYMIPKKTRDKPARTFWSCVRYGWGTAACNGTRKLEAQVRAKKS